MFKRFYLTITHYISIVDNMKIKKILVNRAKCNYCGWVIESQSRHHLNICDCGKFFVDGGQEYLRRGGDNWTEMSEFEEVEIEVSSI
jgi:hypothetical protein